MKSIKERAEFLKSLPSYVVIGKKDGDEIYQGVIENSFSMDLSKNRINVFWSSQNAVDMFGNTGLKVDGRVDAERYRDYFAKGHSDMVFEVVDLHSPDCCVVIDWEEKAEAGMPDPKKLSGVKDKFRARNPRFTVRSVF